MITLLDINVLIGLVDQASQHHAAATEYLRSVRISGWATCPLTENGFLRILGNPNYPGGPGSTDAARGLFSGLVGYPGHQFWADDLTLTNPDGFPTLPPSKDLTDLYLLALAVKHGGRFATFDRRFEPSIVPNGPAAYLVLPTA